MKTVDRYLLRELVFPFLIALIGFLIFVLLNLILGLRDFMLDRSIGLGTILQLLAYQLPFFLVLSLPVAMLFSIFIALGRLAHDREIVALQASGLSLKRIVLPILVLSILISGLALSLNDRMVPWANYRYQELVRQLILRRSTPQIQDNTFFKDSEGRFFYVKHYDRSSGKLQGIMVYDLAGTQYLPELAGRYPKVIVAEEGSWDGEVWRLRDGVIHKYDDRGHLQYELRFEDLAINVGGGLEQLFLTQRTPQEMTLGELGRRIKALREGGLPAEGLVVEYHSKISIPLSAFIFALFGAPLSLIFSARSRAAGVVIAVLLVGLFQGSLIWAQTLGKRGIIAPALSAWLPNLLFGLVGLVLFLVMDRLSQLDLRERLQRLLHLHLVLMVVLLLPLVGRAAEPPRLEIRADSLTISQDWSEVSAAGGVAVKYSDNSIKAQVLELHHHGRGWKIHAAEGVELLTGDILALGGELQAELYEDDLNRLSLKEAELTDFSGEDRQGSLTYSGGGVRLVFDKSLERVEISQGAKIEYGDGSLQAQQMEITRVAGEQEAWLAQAAGEVALREPGRTTAAEHLELRFTIKEEKFQAERARVDSFHGQASFTNSKGEQHLLRYQGERASLSFDQENEISLLDMAGGDFTTCTCSEVMEKDAYCIDAERVLIFGDNLLVATNITLRAFGIPIFWYPLYVAPLKEERPSPLLPELGQSASLGWYAKWSLPFILDERTYGTFLLHYFNRYHQLGGGVDLNYDLFGSGGSLHFYKRFGALGLVELALTNRTELPQGVMLQAGANYRSELQAGATGEWMGYQARLSGGSSGWNWMMDFGSDHYVGTPQEDEELEYRSLARLPEFWLTQSTKKIGPVSYSLGLSWGRYREQKLDETEFDRTTRFAALLNLGWEEISLLEDKLLLRSGGSYRWSLYGRGAWMETLTLSPTLNLRPLQALNLSLGQSFRLVRGGSPFAFDQEERLNRVDLTGNWHFKDPEGLRGSFSTAYDLEGGEFDPLELDWGYRRGLSATSLGLSYDLNRGQLQETTFNEALSGEGWSLVASTGYDFITKNPSDLIAKLALGKFKLGVRYGLDRLSIKRFNTELFWELGEDWELSLKAEYDLLTRRLTAFQYGLVRGFCHSCWEIGLYGSGEQVWIQARINAFPTASFKYSPTDQELAFGD